MARGKGDGRALQLLSIGWLLLALLGVYTAIRAPSTSQLVIGLGQCFLGLVCAWISFWVGRRKSPE